MKTLLKLLIIVSLLLAPYAGPAQAAAHEDMPAASMMSVHAAMGHDMGHDMGRDMAKSMTTHDCCEQPAVAAELTPHDCDNSCSNCQHHCSSSASGLVAMFNLDTHLHPLVQWPAVRAVPVARTENQIRPPMF